MPRKLVVLVAIALGGCHDDPALPSGASESSGAPSSTLATSLATTEGGTQASTSLAPTSTSLTTDAASTGATTGEPATCVLGDPLVHIQTMQLPGRGMALAWAPDGAAVAAGGHFKDPDTGRRYDTKLYDVATGEHLKSFDCHYYWVIGLAWQDNPHVGPVIADGGYDHAVKLWDPGGPGSASCDPGQFDPAEGALVKYPELDGATTALAFSPEGRFLAAANRDRTIRLWDLAPGPRQHKVVSLWYDEPAGNFLSVVFSPAGDRIATGDKMAGRVAVWTFDPELDLWDDATVEAFAGVGFDNQASWYNQNAALVTRTPLWADPDHGSVWNVRFSPDGLRVAAAAADGGLSVFDAETGALLYRVEAPVKTELHGLDWHPSGQFLAAGGKDHNIYLFDAESGALAQTLTGHADLVPALAWSPDGCMLASTAGGKRVSTVDEIHTKVEGPDQTIRIWAWGGDPFDPSGGDSSTGGDMTTTSTTADASTGGSTGGSTGDPPPPPPPPPNEAYEGFGATTPGGAGGKEIHVTEATEAAVRAALQQADAGNAIVIFDVGGPIEVNNSLLVKGDFVTVEGQGVTLDGSGLGATEALLDVRGHDVIVRDMRLRNGGDNLRAQDTGAYNIVFSHISSTGAMDDGLSIGYGAHDVTVQYCFFAGNTRSLFVKYGGSTDVTIHHSWLMKQWIRGPLIYDAFADLRNLIVEDWTLWGSRFESGGHGNAVSSLWRLSDHAVSAGGKADSSLYAYMGADPAQIHVSGNQYAGKAKASPSLAQGTAPAAFPAPAVTTQSVAAMTPIVEAKAGCLPRDAVDQAYIDLAVGWDVADGEPLRLGP